MGAKVTIVARHMGRLEAAREELEAARGRPEGASARRSFCVHIVSADVTDIAAADQMVADAEILQAAPIDYVFCCAGAAVPGLFAEQSPQTFADQMSLNYQGAVNTISVRKSSPSLQRRRGGIAAICPPNNCRESLLPTIVVHSSSRQAS